MIKPAYRTDRIITLDSLVEAAAAASPVPVPPPSSTIKMSTPEDKNAPMSKSARVRQLIENEPEIRNKDIVERLSGFGVSIHDVGNVRSQLKRQGAKAKAKPKPAVAASKPTSVNVARPTASAPATPSDSEIRVSAEVLEAAMDFVQRAGGLNEAQFALTMIRRIKSL